MDIERPTGKIFEFNKLDEAGKHAVFFLGKVGSTELVELDEIEYVMAPDNSVGVPIHQLGKLVSNAEPDSILWIRTEPDEPAPPENQTELPDPVSSFANGRLAIDHHKLEVFIDGSALELPKREYDLIELLAANKGKFLERQEILYSCWGADYFGTGRTVDVHVQRLRRKLGDLNWTIQTKRSVGYMFDDLTEPGSTKT